MTGKIHFKSSRVLLPVLYICIVKCVFELLCLNSWNEEYIFLSIICLIIPFLVAFRGDEFIYMRYIPVFVYLMAHWVVLLEHQDITYMSGITGTLMDWERLSFVTVFFIQVVIMYEPPGHWNYFDLVKAISSLYIYGFTGVIKSAYLFLCNGRDLTAKTHEWILYCFFMMAFHSFITLLLIPDLYENKSTIQKKENKL